MIGLPGDNHPSSISHSLTLTNIPSYIHLHPTQCSHPSFSVFQTTSLRHCIFFFFLCDYCLHCFLIPCWSFYVISCHSIEQDYTLKNLHHVRMCHITFLIRPREADILHMAVSWWDRRFPRRITGDYIWAQSQPVEIRTGIIPFLELICQFASISSTKETTVNVADTGRNGHISRKVKIELCCHLNNIESSGR